MQLVINNIKANFTMPQSNHSTISAQSETYVLQRLTIIKLGVTARVGVGIKVMLRVRVIREGMREGGRRKKRKRKGN